MNLEERGPWISLPTGVYRRVNAFTFQPDDVPRRTRDGAIQPPPSNLLATSSASHRTAPLRHPASNQPLPRPVTRSDDSLGSVPRTRPNRVSSSRREVVRPSTSIGKRPLVIAEGSSRRKDARETPSSPDSVGSSSACFPPGFGVGEPSRPPSGPMHGPLDSPLLGPPLAPGPSSGEVDINLGLPPTGDGVSAAADQPASRLVAAISGAAPFGPITSQVVSGADLDRPLRCRDRSRVELSRFGRRLGGSGPQINVTPS
ncbi:hypothetical protein LINGRAHAP2_LOCUS31369 [Linum grandiflorum]